MKLLPILSGVVLMILSTSCSTNRNTARFEADDRYYSLADARREARQLKKLNQTQPAESAPRESVENMDGFDTPDNQAGARTNDYTPMPDNNGGAPIVNNYYDVDYDMDDYYDYMFASRIRRFHRPMPGFGYYDPFFTNMYWYNYDPFMFGNSIYSTYSFFNPFVPWGWNTWTPGINFGWNSFNGWNINIGFNSWNNPWNNPWHFNNPWRWNTWGYDPFMSPFAYNPFFYSPFNYGLGFQQGFNNGFAYGMMMNNMFNNPVYYNSFDYNTYNFNAPISYGPNTGGIGGGSGFTTAPNLTSNFSKQLGMTPSVAHSGKDGKPLVNSTGGNVVKPVNNLGTAQDVKGGSTPVNQNNAYTGSGKQPGTVQNNSTKPGVNGVQNPSSPGKQDINSPVQPGKQTPNGVQPVQAQQPGKQTGTGTQPVQAQQPGKVNQFSPAPSGTSGKDQLIQQGVTRPKADNYTSAPVNSSQPQVISDNTPSSPFGTRPSNDLRNPGNGVSPVNGGLQSRPGQPVTGAPQKELYNPNYNYNNAIRNNTPEVVRPNTPSTVRPQQPTTRPEQYSPQPITRPNDVRQPTNPSVRPDQPVQQQPRQQDFRQPQMEQRNPVQPQMRQPESQPRNNFQQMPQQQQQYRQPQSVPRNNYQEYQRQPERQNNFQQYQSPQREQRNMNQQYQQYQTPQREQRMQSSPRMESSPRMSSPRMESSPRMSSPRMESSPRMSSPSSSPRPSAPSGGNRMSSPRR